MENKILRIKWAGPNTPLIEIGSSNNIVYTTKRELLSIRDELSEFISYYEDNFKEGVLDNIDETEL